MPLQILLPAELELLLMPELFLLELFLLELALLLLIRLSYKRRNRIRLQQQLTKQVFFSFHSPFFSYCITPFNKRKQKN